MSKIIEISDEKFESEVIKENKLVLVYFWAPWCGPCRLISPAINSLPETYGEHLKIVKLEVDPNPEAVKRCQVKGVPALRLFKGEEILESREGAISKQRIAEMLASYFEQ